MHAKPPSHPSRWLILLAALPLLVAAAHGLLWLWLVGRLEAGLDHWATAQRAAGGQVGHGPATRGGWPWAASLTLPMLRLVDPGGLAWQGTALELRLALPWPTRLALAASGAQQLEVGPAVLPFTTTSLTGSLPLLPGPQPLRLQAEALAAATPAGPLLLRRAALALATQPGGSLLDLALEGLALPALPAATAALGPEIGRVALQLALAGPLPLAALQGGVPSTSQAMAWRDAGGRLELRALDVVWGPVQAGGTGELTLDPTLQPTARATLRLAGLVETLDALLAAGLLTPANARGLRTMVQLLQLAPAEPGPPRLNLPLLLRDRTLSVAGFTLLRLAPLRWSAQ